jgi:hypothetical protein
MNKTLNKILSTILILLITFIIPLNCLALSTISATDTLNAGRIKINTNFTDLQTSIANVLDGTTDFTKLDVDNLVLNSNTFGSIAGKVIVAPLAGQDLELTTSGAGKTNVTAGNFAIASGNLVFNTTTRFTNAGAITATLADIDNVKIDANTVTSSDTNGNLTVAANGSGMPIASNATYSTNLIKDYANLYNNTDQTTSITTGGTYYQVTFETEGNYRGAVPSNANDDITIDHTGLYRITYMGKARDGTINKRITFRLKKNNGATDFPESQCEIKTEPSGDNYQVQLGNSTIVSLTHGDTVELWVECEQASSTITHRITISINEI